MTEKPKNPAAQALGRLGGKAPRKGLTGFARMTKKQRRAAAAKSHAARRAKIKKP
jgi:hypothetical protein